MIDIILDNPFILLGMFSAALGIFSFCTIENVVLKGVLGIAILLSILSVFTGLQHPDKSKGINSKAIEINQCK